MFSSRFTLRVFYRSCPKSSSRLSPTLSFALLSSTSRLSSLRTPRAPLSRESQQLRNFSTSIPQYAQYIRFSSKPTTPTDPNSHFGSVTLAGIILGGAGIYYVTHLEQVPETGRWRFMDINPKYEAKLAKTSHQQLLDTFGDKILPPNHPITVHVQRVVSNLLESSNLGTLRSQQPTARYSTPNHDIWGDDGFMVKYEDFASDSHNKEWNLLVVNDPRTVNAMASFGNIVVFTGILPICKDEQGLAAVLGHEIGHVVARHPSETYSSAKVLIFVSFLLNASGLDLGMGLGNWITHLLLELPNSRIQETEADTIGMRLLAKACFDPQAAVEMHTRLGALEKGIGKIEFLRTHPGPEQRIKHLESLLPEASSIRAAHCAGTHDSFERFRSLSRVV